VVDGKAAAYVCEHYACKLSVTSAEALDKIVSGRIHAPGKQQTARRIKKATVTW